MTLNLSLSKALALCALMLAGCGNGASKSSPRAQPPASNASFGITALVKVEGHPEQSGWTRVAPVDWGAWDLKKMSDPSGGVSAQSASPRGPAALSLKPPSLHLQGTVQQGSGGSAQTTDTNQDDAQKNYAPGWSLLYWATTACLTASEAHDVAGSPPASVRHLTGLDVTSLPWADNAYYFFMTSRGARPDKQSCDVALAMQETLLCAADHLAQLGDSPGTVTWSGTSGTAATPTNITVTIPPQRSDDIFIARDMALNALAHLLRLDTVAHTFHYLTPSGPSTISSTCVQEYTSAAQGGWFATSTSNSSYYVSDLFETHPSNSSNGIEDSIYFDSTPLTHSSSSAEYQAAAVRRLTRKATVIIGAARLAKDLVERSVQADIAGAQQRLSSSTDYLAGARAAWGVDTTQTPYNTFRHALRTLFGRLEIGNNASSGDDGIFGPSPSGLPEWTAHDITRDDPRCGVNVETTTPGHGIASLDALSVVPGISARWDDAPPKTQGESLALSLLGDAGIIFSPATFAASAVDASSGRSAVDQAVRQFLLGKAAAEADPTGTATPPFAQTEGGKALSATLDSIHPEEMSFALQRVYDSFRLLTESEPQAPLSASPAHADLALVAGNAGLTLRRTDTGNDTLDTLGDPIINLGGIILASGLVRDDLSVDPMAYLGSAQAVSSCGVFPIASGSVPNVVTQLDYSLSPNSLDVAGFQNPFLLAEGFRRVLSTIDGEATQFDVASLKPVADFSRLAAAEVRAWAGPGVILTSRSADFDHQDIYLVNIAPEELGVSGSTRQAQLDELGSRLVLVSSLTANYSAAANCAAGLRQSCNGLTSAIRSPSVTLGMGGAEDSVNISDVSDPGVVSPVLQTRLREGLDNPTIKVSFPFAMAPGAHLVLRPLNGKPGQVLGWLKTSVRNDEYFVESFSNEQRALARQVFGIDKPSQASRSCSDEVPVTLPADYCISGMRRDQFVPLGNELNSAGASPSIDDSWKNYLQLARAASDKADQLGEQLIKEGLEPELRKEAATEALGDLCGSYLSVDDVNADGGKITPPAGDEQLKQCLTPATTDIVFLRKDPITDETTDAQIRMRFCSGVGTNKPPFCARTGPILHAGLGFQSGAAQPISGDIAASCADIRNSLVPGPSEGSLAAQALSPPQVQGATFGNAISKPWASAVGIASALQGMSLQERADGQWILKVGSRVVTGSDALVDKAFTGGNPATGSTADVWPRCVSLPVGTGEAAGSKCSSIATYVASMFPPEEATVVDDPLHASLRSNIERTVFYMGALAGGLPAGTITMPVPVANRAESGLHNAVIPAPAVYGLSTFQQNGQETPGAPGNLGDTPKSLFTISGDNGAFVAMGQPARPFQFPTERDYLTSRSASGPTWRQALYQQALARFDAHGYLYVDASNAGLRFDPEFGANGGTLQAWLTDRAAQFNSAPGAFLDSVRQITYLTAAENKPTAADQPTSSSPNASQPDLTYQFCRLPFGVGGRSVCGDAPVSPIFHTLDDSTGYTTGLHTCDGYDNIQTPLDVTVNVRSNDRCLADYTLNGAAKETPVDRQPPLTCSGHNVPNVSVPDGNGGFIQVTARNLKRDNVAPGWFAPDEASGGTVSGKSFLWNSTQSVCSSTATESWQIDGNCVPYNDVDPWGTGTSRAIWDKRLKAQTCPPEQRLEMFLDKELGSDQAKASVSAMQALVQALGLSCMSANQNLGIRLKDVPPQIRTVDDINVLESWLNLFGYDVNQIGNVLFLVDVPTDVVTLATAGQSDVGSVTAGERGKMLLDLESKLSLLENGFSSLSNSLQQIGQAISKARLEIQAAQLASHQSQLGISASKIENDKSRNLAYVSLIAEAAKAAVATASSISLGSAFDNGSQSANELIDTAATIRGDQISLDALKRTDDNLLAQSKVIGETGENAEAQAVLSLGQSTQGLYQSINDTITGLKTNNNGALQDINDLKGISAKANISLAKAGGADFISINGKDIPDHVNTVYRRQFDITRQRYQLAIESAKRTAYLARLSIEQRLGVRLDELHVNVGPLEAPATWADDVCTVQGVDYDKLRTATVGTTDTSPTAVDTVKGFASQFIGDYIDKLEQFVQFYNVQFPFVDSNDVAIVSLREDLPSSESQCLKPSTNLLLHSDDLTARSPDRSSSEMVARAGWRITPCNAGACLNVQGSGALVNSINGLTPVILAPPGGAGHASLLTTIVDPGIGTTETGDVDDAGAPLPPPASPAPSSALFQTVSLTAGTSYVLSWWDMARAPDGGPQGTEPIAPYGALVFDSNWSPIAGDANFTPAKGNIWSARHTIELVASRDGDYHVLFTAGPAGKIGHAVAIANVQLEASAGNLGVASAYESTQASRVQDRGNCPVDSPDSFRSRFDRKCDATGCYFELRDVLAIDTQLLQGGSSSLIGKLANGNFNYRNNTIALNVVGTGVIDCSQSKNASCNGSAYLEYDLDHVAYNVPISDYEGGTRCFDFGAGSVRGGKALASERFITLPMSSSDRDMIEQSPFLKPDFSGRPLSGAYRLRIHDAPQLVWSSVDDVQIVMNYGYWSRVARSPGN